MGHMLAYLGLTTLAGSTGHKGHELAHYGLAAYVDSSSANRQINACTAKT